MKKHNKSLDFITLAMATALKGQHVTAAKLFAKACTQADTIRAIHTLEASNAQAFKLEAKAKQVARKAVRAAEDDFDVGDVSDLIDTDGDGDADVDVDVNVDPDDEVDAAFGDDDEDDDLEEDGDDSTFATTLAAMMKKKAKSKTKAKTVTKRK